MVVTPYNHRVRLLSSESFGWFALPKFTRAWEVTLLWNHFTNGLPAKRALDLSRQLLCAVDKQKKLCPSPVRK